MRQPFNLVVLIVLLLNACASSNRKLILGSQRHGLNKVIQSNQQEKENYSNTEQENASPERHEMSTIHEGFAVQPTTSASPTAPENATKNVFKTGSDSLPGLEEILEVQQELRSSIRQITHQPKKKVDVLSDETNDSNATAAIVIIVIILFIILGVILISYLFFNALISAFNSASESAIEEACYIATMSYGDYDHPKVKVLRAFRDDYLQKRKWGRQFIRWYYRKSPGFTRFYANNRFVHFYLRQYLNIFVFFIQPFFKIK